MKLRQAKKLAQRLNVGKIKETDLTTMAYNWRWPWRPRWQRAMRRLMRHCRKEQRVRVAMAALVRAGAEYVKDRLAEPPHPLSLSQLLKPRKESP